MTIGSLTTSGGNTDGASSTIRAASGTIRAGGVVTLSVRGGLAGVTTVSRSVSGVQEVVLRVLAVLVDVGGGGVGRVAILAVLIVVTVVGSGGDRRLEASEVHGDRLEGAGGARGDGVSLGGGTAGLGGLLQINKVRHGRATHRRNAWTKQRT